MKQETVSGSGISWAICKSAPRSRQITTPAPHHSVFYRPDDLPATQPTAWKHWRQPVKHKAHYCHFNPLRLIHFTSPAGWLPVHQDQLRAQRSVTSMGKLLPFTTTAYLIMSYLHNPMLVTRFNAAGISNADLTQSMQVLSTGSCSPLCSQFLYKRHAHLYHQ